GLIGQKYGWRASFIVFGILGIALGVILHRFLREPVRGASESATHEPVKNSPLLALRVVARTPTLWVLMAAFAGANFVAMVLLAWMPDYLNKQFGMNLAVAG